MKTSVYIGSSMDCFIAREDGDIEWLTQFANDEAVSAYQKFITGIDAIVIGRGTFEKILSFPSWPYDKKTFVLSTGIKVLPDIVKPKAAILTLQPREVLSHLSNEGFSNIYVDGGKVIQSFLKEDLVDELIISQVPLLIGSGIPLFGHVDTDLLFNHIRTEVQSNGLVRSYYERARK